LRPQNREYIAATLVTLAFSVLYGVLEYYWIVTDRDVPFRYGNQPIFLGQFNMYHITIMFPLFIIAAFAPLIDDLVVKSNPIIEKWYTFFLGMAGFGFAILVEDITWFLSRLINPLQADPLGGRWIQSWTASYASAAFCRQQAGGIYVCTEWTAQRGFIQIGQVVIPYWYIVVGFLAAVVWFMIFKRVSEKHTLLLRYFSIFPRKLGSTPNVFRFQRGVPQPPPDLTGIHTLAIAMLDSSKTMRERRKAAEEVAARAIRFRRRGELKTLLAELGKIPKFGDKVFAIATDIYEPEPIRRTFAWTLSQINDWPTYFNERVLDNKKVQRSISIDGSLTFLPPLGHATELPPDEQLDLARRFLPHFDGKGFELRWDTKKYYVGPFFRVMKHPDDDTRACIQYVYIWSRQMWPLSAFFTFYFWPALSLLAVIPWLLGKEVIVATYLLSGLGLILIFYGLLRTLYPKEMRCFRNDTWYVVGGILLLIALNLYGIWGTAIPFVAAIALFLIKKYVLEDTEHIMDYEPVYLYIKRRKKESNEWYPERARIDNFHYETTEAGSKKLEQYVNKDHTLFIETDNIWRSFEFVKPHGSHSPWNYHAYVFGWIALYCFTAGLIVASALPKFSSFFSVLPHMEGVWLLAWSFVATLGLVLLNKSAETPISDPKNPRINSAYLPSLEHVLDDKKLVHLWNMIDDKANFVIRVKLQNPFRTPDDKSFWKTFRDPSAERLAYEALLRTQSLVKTSQDNKTTTRQANLP
jgi:hypothetical protein